MSTTWRQAVNAHLRKAGALLEFALEQQGAKTSRLAQLALQEAALFQQQLCVLFFLREIAENYQLAEADKVQNSAQLQALFAAVNKQPAELSEIITLQQEGWLRGLERCYARLQQAPKAPSQSPVKTASASLISSRQQADDELDLEQVQNWQARLNELVERQREMMVEC